MGVAPGLTCPLKPWPCPGGKLESGTRKDRGKVVGAVAGLCAAGWGETKGERQGKERVQVCCPRL